METLDWVLKQDVSYIDIGHYTPATLENIKDLREYMIDLHAQVLSLVRQGQSWDQLYWHVKFSDKVKMGRIRCNQQAEYCRHVSLGNQLQKRCVVDCRLLLTNLKSMQTENNQNNKQEPLRILVFSASLRTDSLNTRLAKLAASLT